MIVMKLEENTALVLVEESGEEGRGGDKCEKAQVVAAIDHHHLGTGVKG